MVIIRNRKKGKCIRCIYLIKSKYKIREYMNTYSHLSCYYKYLIKEIETLKNEKKKFNKKKYQRTMILEALNNET